MRRHKQRRRSIAISLPLKNGHHRRHRPQDHGVEDGVESGRSHRVVGRPRKSCHQSMRPRKSMLGGRQVTTRRSWVCTQRPNTWLGVSRLIILSRRHLIGNQIGGRRNGNRPGIPGHLMPSITRPNGHLDRCPLLGHLIAIIYPQHGNQIGTRPVTPGHQLPSAAFQNGNRYVHRRRDSRRYVLFPTATGLFTTDEHPTIRPTAVA